MLGWLDEVAGPGYSQAVLWTVLVLLLLVVLLIVVKVVRSMMFGTFVSGGRNRKTRLAVMDATAVDSHRRLVLVRRDDVEHLILIGGAADIVVERDIRISHRRAIQPGEPAPHIVPVAPEQAPAAAPPPVALPKQAPESPAVLPRPPALKPPAPVPTAPRAPETMIARATPRPEVQRPASPPPAPAPRPAPRPEPVAPVLAVRAPPPAPSSDDLDDALLKELEVSLDDGDVVPPKAPTPTLDDEMAKLLGELSKPRR